MSTIANPILYVDELIADTEVAAPLFTGDLVGNAATATKLATARTIFGQSFDGTGNVSGAGTFTTVTASGRSAAARHNNSEGSQSVVNNGTIDITVSARANPLLMVGMSGATANAAYLGIVRGDGSANAFVTAIHDSIGGDITVAGTSATAIRITNNSGSTRTISWGLVYHKQAH